MQAQGKIIDIKSNQPLPLATITITDSSGAGIDVNKRTSADKEGFFKISVMPKDYLTVSYVGYKSKTLPVSSFSSDTKTIGLTYQSSGEQKGGMFKGFRGETEDNGALTNQPIKWYYWVFLGLAGFFIYKKLKNNENG